MDTDFEYNRSSHTSFPSPAPASETVPLLSEASFASSIQNTNSAFVFGTNTTNSAEGLSQTSLGHGGGSLTSKKSVAETQKNTAHSVTVHASHDGTERPVQEAGCSKASIVITVLLIIAVCVVALLVAVVPLVALVASYECKDVVVTSIVHPADTVHGASLSSGCQLNALLKPAKPTRDIIDVYATDCNNLTVHSELLNYTSPVYPDVHNAISIIDESNKVGSNYYVKNTTVDISLHIFSSNSSTETLLCLFGNSSYFGTFLYPDDREHFLRVLKFAIKCYKIQGESSRNVRFTINDTGYYFAGVSSFQILESLQINVSLTRNFYDRSDFLQDHVNCHLVQTTNNCTVNSTFADTCIMLHATVADIADFNYIGISAAGKTVYHSLPFKIVMPFVGVVFVIAVLVVVVVVVMAFYFNCLHCRFS